MPGLRERKKAATRLAIRDAGMRLFDEHGFGGTTVDDIAEAAGVSRATVFTYFPTKEEIVFGDAASAVEAPRGTAARGRRADHRQRPRLAHRAHRLARARTAPAASPPPRGADRRRPPSPADRRARGRHRRGARDRARPRRNSSPHDSPRPSLMSGLTAIEERAAAQLSATRSRPLARGDRSDPRPHRHLRRGRHRPNPRPTQRYRSSGSTSSTRSGCAPARARNCSVNPDCEKK